MKICNKCSIEKPFTEFHKRGKGYQSVCKQCKAVYSKSYYTDNAESCKASRKRVAQEYLKWYADLKRSPCTDCGIEYDPVCMQWDHLPEYEKVASLGTLLSLHNKAKILEEIQKCELVCANCHCLRTKSRKSLSSNG